MWGLRVVTKTVTYLDWWVREVSGRVALEVAIQEHSENRWGKGSCTSQDRYSVTLRVTQVKGIGVRGNLIGLTVGWLGEGSNIQYLGWEGWVGSPVGEKATQVTAGPWASVE